MTTKQPREVDVRKLLSAVEAQRNLMVAIATGGPAIETENYQYSHNHFAIRTALGKLGLRYPNPYADLWDWYGKWSSDLPTYQSRREYLRDLYAPLLEQLRQLALDIESPTEPLRELTGWERVDRELDKVRQALARGESEEDYQTIGLRCRETLISLAQAVYAPDVHLAPDGITPSDTDAKRMLEGYIEGELAGGSNEEARQYAKAALRLANGLQHRRTADFRAAAACAEATASVVNFIAIVSGRRDPKGSA